MSVSKTLNDAWVAVGEANLPKELHQAAFREAVRILAGATDNGPQRSADDSRQGRTNSGVGSPSGKPASADGAGADGASNGIALTESELAKKVAQGTDCDAAKLEQLFHVDEGRVLILIPGIRLGKGNADKVRNIARIFSMVYAFGLDLDGVPVDVVRAEAVRLKCYDNTNFAKQLPGMAPQFVVTGTRPNKIIRPKTSGISGFAELVESLTVGIS